MNPKCETCRWFARVGQTAYGQCRLIEPVAGYTGQAVWPRVQISDYCGKHEPAPAQPPANP